jgi:catechol 2,3-dioxygenase-like lactoylglutathione lyase family enzyme
MSFARAAGLSRMTQTTTHLKHLANVMVPVSDQDAALDFYVHTLGFEKRADMPFGDGDRWLEVGIPGAETGVALTLHRGEEWTVGRQTGISIATDDADAVHARLSDAGVDVDEQVMKVGGPVPPMFWLRDGDGNSLLIVEA